eukprot:gene12228-8751_t
MSESVPLSFLVQHQEQLLQCAAFADACPLATNYLLHQQMGPFGLVVNIVALRGAAASPTPLRVHLVVDNHLRFPTASLQLTAAQFDLMRERPADGGLGPANGALGPADGGLGPADGGLGPADGALGPADGGLGPADGALGPAVGGLGPADGRQSDASPRAAGRSRRPSAASHSSSDTPTEALRSRRHTKRTALSPPRCWRNAAALGARDGPEGRAAAAAAAAAVVVADRCGGAEPRNGRAL